MKRYTYTLTYTATKQVIRVIVFAINRNIAEDRARAIMNSDDLHRQAIVAELVEVAELPPNHNA